MIRVKPEATSSMVEVLTPIWQRVLQLPSIDLNDNFFDLGGDLADPQRHGHAAAVGGCRGEHGR